MEDGEALGDHVRMETMLSIAENEKLIESNLVDVNNENNVKEEFVRENLNNNVEPFEGDLVESDSGFQSRYLLNENYFIMEN